MPDAHSAKGLRTPKQRGVIVGIEDERQEDLALNAEEAENVVGARRAKHEVHQKVGSVTSAPGTVTAPAPPTVAEDPNPFVDPNELMQAEA
jgi:hypothetical protein